MQNSGGRSRLRPGAAPASLIDSTTERRIPSLLAHHPVLIEIARSSLDLELLQEPNLRDLVDAMIHLDPQAVPSMATLYPLLPAGARTAYENLEDLSLVAGDPSAPDEEALARDYAQTVLSLERRRLMGRLRHLRNRSPEPDLQGWAVGDALRKRTDALQGLLKDPRQDPIGCLQEYLRFQPELKEFAVRSLLP
jgi:hypothetical protein